MVSVGKQIGLSPMCGQLLIDTLCFILEARSVLQGGTAVIKKELRCENSYELQSYTAAWKAAGEKCM